MSQENNMLTVWMYEGGKTNPNNKKKPNVVFL